MVLTSLIIDLTYVLRKLGLKIGLGPISAQVNMFASATQNKARIFYQQNKGFLSLINDDRFAVVRGTDRSLHC